VTLKRDGVKFDRQLTEMVGHQFADPSLLIAALTHPSVGELEGRRLYERMEFLGDRALGLVIAELLLERFPDESEGALSQRLVSLVRAEALAKVAMQLKLEDHVTFSASAAGDDGRGRTSLLSDACEALIGALFLDGGLEPARAFVRRHWADLVTTGAPKPPLDPKTALQEWLQGRGQGLPSYREVSREGPAHAPEFTIEVMTADGEAAQAIGSNKRSAEQAAAETLLQRLEASDD
jgi:ribonuclease-3